VPTRQLQVSMHPTQGLPATPAGKAHQLWVIVNAKPVSVGVVSPGASGAPTEWTVRTHGAPFAIRSVTSAPTRVMMPMLVTA